MADAVWPASLPQAPRTASLRERLPDLTVRTKMAVGPDKVRRRASVGTRQFDCELDLSAAQLATLQVFYLDTLEGGALTFEWKDHRTGDTTEYRFLGPPQAYPRMPRKADQSEPWRASFSIEEIPAASDEDGGGGGGGEFSPGTFDPMQIAGPAGGGQDAGDTQLMFLPFEADAPPPEFLLEALVVVEIQGDDSSAGTDITALPIQDSGGNGQGPFFVIGGSGVGSF